MASNEAYPSPPPSPPRGGAKVDPILRNAFRYTISEKEYKTLHQYLVTRSPPAVRKRAPQPPRYNAIVQSKDDHNAAAVRASLRLFVASQAGLRIWDIFNTRILGRGVSLEARRKASFLKSPNFRLSLSVSLILLLHRLLHRFFSRLRANLLTKDAAPFRRRNPRIARSLTSRLAPAIGASLAGFALGVYPSDQLRITIAIYAAVKAVEFTYNALESDGWFKNKPWWWGSWMLMPLAYGQLLHAFVFDRDCFPKAYGDFILSHTPNYIQRRPTTYPPTLPWPTTNTIVDALAEISRLNYPPFISPILFPNIASTLSPSLSEISPVTSPAHPALTSLSCALLHPSDPSCWHTYLTFHLTAFPALAKFFALVFTIFSLPRYKRFLASPSYELNGLAKRILRTTTFITGAIGTSWGSICLFQSLFPRTLLSRGRWFLGGFLGGLWAFLERKGGRGQFLYSARLSVDSLWKVGVKKGWWRGIRGGDVWVFVMALAVMNIIYEVRLAAVEGSVIRRGMGYMRGGGAVDVVKEREGEGEKEG